jgi:hypothetical protein
VTANRFPWLDAPEAVYDEIERFLAQLPAAKVRPDAFGLHKRQLRCASARDVPARKGVGGLRLQRGHRRVRIGVAVYRAAFVRATRGQCDAIREKITPPASMRPSLVAVIVTSTGSGKAPGDPLKQWAVAMVTVSTLPVE